MRLVFLGTGGGRHMMATQVRKTGGILFDFDGLMFVVDPGPGSIVNARSLKINTEKYSGLLLSHLHPDHCADANALIDGMKDPFVIAEQHCVLPKQKMKDYFDYYPCISVYHQERAKLLKPMKDGDSVKIGGLKIESFKAAHDDPTVGFLISNGRLKIGYPADGEYYIGQEKHYDGCDVLILNVLVPKGLKPDRLKHMSVDGAIRFVNGMKTKPKIIILQHFGFWMLQHNIFKQCKILQDATKVHVVQAEDFMELNLETLKTKILKP